MGVTLFKMCIIASGDHEIEVKRKMQDCVLFGKNYVLA